MKRNIKSRIPNLTGFRQRKIIVKPKEVITSSPDYDLEKCKDHSDILNIDVCLRLKPQTNNIPTKVSIRIKSL